MLAFALLFIASPFTSLAVHITSHPPKEVKIEDPKNPVIREGPQTLAQWFLIFQDIIGWVFVIAVLLAVLTLIIAGIMYITAGGNQEKASKAAKMVMYALVGVAIAGLAWALVNVVGNFFLGKQLIQ